MITAGIFIGINNALTTQAVMMMSPVERSVASAYGFVRFLGSGLSPFAAGKLVEAFNLRVLFVIGAVAVVAEVIMLFTMYQMLAQADQGLDEDPPADDGWSFCNHRPVSTPSPVCLVLFDVDRTLVDHDGAVAAGAQQWLMAMGWADAGTIAGLVSEWDEIAERHFPAYRPRLTTFQGQRRLRLREFLPRVGIDASTWSHERLDELFNTYLVAYEAAWRSFPDAEPCLRALRRVAQIAVLSNGNQQQQEEVVSRTGLGRYVEVVLTSDHLGVAKPDPRAFELACAHPWGATACGGLHR